MAYITSLAGDPLEFSIASSPVTPRSTGIVSMISEVNAIRDSNCFVKTSSGWKNVPNVTVLPKS